MTNTPLLAPSSTEAAGAFRTAPVEVRWALGLLWLSLAVNAAQHVASLSMLRLAQGLFMFSLAIPWAGMIFGGFLNVMIARKKNWARILKLLCVVASFMVQVLIARKFLPALSGTQYFMAGIMPALDFAALYLLFVTSGRLWFRRAASSTQV